MCAPFVCVYDGVADLWVCDRINCNVNFIRVVDFGNNVIFAFCAGCKVYRDRVDVIDRLSVCGVCATPQ